MYHSDVSETQYIFLEENSNIPFACYSCNPDWVCSTVPNNLAYDHTTPSPLSTESNLNSSNSLSSSLNDLTTFSDISLNEPNYSLDCSSAHSSDFVYVDETDSDSESRGLNFESLPARLNSLSYNKKRHPLKNSHSHVPSITNTLVWFALLPVRKTSKIVYVVHYVMSGSTENVQILL